MEKPATKKQEEKKGWRKVEGRNAFGTKLSYEIKKGKMSKKPCFICGEKKTYAFLEDVDELGLIWLCMSHHKYAINLYKRHGEYNN